MARSTRGGRGFKLMRAAALLAAVGLLASMLVSGTASASSYQFNKPRAIAVNGTHLWIANWGGNSVTETTLDGAWVRTISAAKYGFHNPDAIVSYGFDLFVVNHAGSVTELNANTGALIRIVQGAKYHFGFPNAALQQGGHIWVVDTGSNAVTEFSAASGALIRVLTDAGTHYGFKTPSAIALAGADIWVTSKTGGSATDPTAGAVTEFLASNGAFVRRISAAADGLQTPSGIAYNGGHLWISDTPTDSVTELTTTGALTRVITNSSLNGNYGLEDPSVVVASGANVYVISPPGASPMVTQIDAATAVGNWYECNTNTPDPMFVNPTGLIVHGDSVWVVSPGDNTLTQLSLAAGGNRINLFT